MIELIVDDLTINEKIKYLEENGIIQDIFENVPISPIEDGIYSQFIIKNNSLENKILSRYMIMVGVSGFYVYETNEGCVIRKKFFISEYEKFINELYEFKKLQKFKDLMSNFKDFIN